MKLKEGQIKLEDRKFFQYINGKWEEVKLFFIGDQEKKLKVEKIGSNNNTA